MFNLKKIMREHLGSSEESKKKVAKAFRKLLITTSYIVQNYIATSIIKWRRTQNANIRQ